VDPQEQTPVEATEDVQDQPSSRAEREPANGLMNRFLRGLGFGRDEESSEPAAAETEQPEPPEAPTPEPPPPPDDRVTLTQDELRRLVQSQKDKELLQERRKDALERAESGDILPIRTLAEKGDGWARAQLAERGETWALGEIAQAEELRRRTQAAGTEMLPAIATSFDQAVMWPLLGALPVEEEKRIVGEGIVGMDGRKSAVEESIRVIKRDAAREAAEGAVTKALADPAFMGELLKSASFREALLKVPASNKALRAHFRGDLEEGDIAPSASSSRRRENDFMNDLLRGLTTVQQNQDE